jgi:hypothetical protein
MKLRLRPVKRCANLWNRPTAALSCPRKSQIPTAEPCNSLTRQRCLPPATALALTCHSRPPSTSVQSLHSAHHSAAETEKRVQVSLEYMWGGSFSAHLEGFLMTCSIFLADSNTALVGRTCRGCRAEQLIQSQPCLMQHMIMPVAAEQRSR